MKLTIVCLLVAVAAAVAQDFGSFGGFGGFRGGFSGGLDAIQGARDPRQNTGPVVFPQAPADSGETSGVVVGASGYGFVPPQSPSSRLQSFF